MENTYIVIEPEENTVELRVLQLNQEHLCNLIRCDATDAVDLPFGLIGYIDGEGAWQGRQVEWELQGSPCWGTMIIAKKNEQDEEMLLSCEEEDLENIQPLIHFFEDG